MAVLEKERKFYETQKQDLVRTHSGQFALIEDDKLVGVFTTFPEAYAEGVKRFGFKPFLVQEVKDHEPLAQQPALDIGAIVVR